MIKKYVKFQKKEEERQEKQGRLFIKGLQMKVETVGEVAVNHGYDQQKGCFESASVVLPVINEVRSLQQTVDILFEYTEESIREVIIVVCDKTTSESLFVCNELRKRYTGKIRIIWQVLPFLGGALREGLISATGSHVIVMFSDGESDPRTVGDLVMMAKGHPDEIISASRWLKRNSFEGYPALKTFLNYFFHEIF